MCAWSYYVQHVTSVGMIYEMGKNNLPSGNIRSLISRVYNKYGDQADPMGTQLSTIIDSFLNSTLIEIPQVKMSTVLQSNVYFILFVF